MEITDILKQIFTIKGKEFLSNRKQITGMLLDRGEIEPVVERISNRTGNDGAMIVGWVLAVFGQEKLIPQPQAQTAVVTQISPTKQTTVQQPQQRSGNISVAPAVGNVVQFGAYDWLVLDVQPGRALLLTKDCVEKQQYHSIYNDITWGDCTLRQYLNSEFLGKFAANDLRRILTTRNVNLNNPWRNTPGGAATDDKIFLLSLDEVVGYFGDSIAKAKLKNRPGNDRWINGEHFRNEIIANLLNSPRLWWLRSRGIASHAAGISSDGCVSVCGSRVDNGFGGVRPALWINLES